jgi:hypothetical protein
VKGKFFMERFQETALSLEGVYTESVEAAWPKVNILLGFDARNQDIHDDRDLQ